MRIDCISRTVPFPVSRNQQGPHIGLVCYVLVDNKILTVMHWFNGYPIPLMPWQVVWNIAEMFSSFCI